MSRWTDWLLGATPGTEAHVHAANAALQAATTAAARSPLRMIQEGGIEVQDRAGRVLAPVQLRTEKRDEGEVLIVVVET